MEDKDRTTRPEQQQEGGGKLDFGEDDEDVALTQRETQEARFKGKSERFQARGCALLFDTYM